MAQKAANQIKEQEKLKTKIERAKKAQSSNFP
jgi:hypothetical protein